MPWDGMIIRPTGRISTIADINEARANMVPDPGIHFHGDEPKRTWEDNGPFRPEPSDNPVAAFVVVVDGLDVSVDATAAYDPEDSTLTYVWDWDDLTANGSGVTATHTYAADGTYTITLLVTDVTGETDEIAVDVTVAAPV